MTFKCKILKDSISPDGARLTTFEVTFPRMVLSEFNTHRTFSRNSASSRAIPVEKMLKMVQENPYIPHYWGKNQKGMQAEAEVDQDTATLASKEWLQSRDMAVQSANRLLSLGIHKQITNRLLEPFMWHTVIVTATEWDNFFNLRDNKDAQPEIKTIAHMMKELYFSSSPETCYYDQWHLPLIDKEDFELEVIRDTSGRYDLERLKKISAGRCARVSYLTHDGKRDHEADIELHDRLLSGGHMSPLEHVARPIDYSDLNQLELENKLRLNDKFIGNFKGWFQYRKMISGEHNILGLI